MEQSKTNDSFELLPDFHSVRVPCLRKMSSLRDFVGNSMGLQNCLAAEDQDFIEIKYGVASTVENDTFVSVSPVVPSGGIS